MPVIEPQEMYVTYVIVRTSTDVPLYNMPVNMTCRGAPLYMPVVQFCVMPSDTLPVDATHRCL
jgi:hypothetical protein